MKLRAERRIITFILIIAIVNLQVFLCQEDNSSREKTKEKVKKLSKNKEKLNTFKQLKQANVTRTLDSDDDDTKDTLASIKTTTATTATTWTSSSTRLITSTTAAPDPEPEPVNNEEKLMEHLLSIRRNKHSRPKKNWTEPVIVKIGMALIHLGIFLTALLPLPHHTDGWYIYFRS